MNFISAIYFIGQDAEIALQLEEANEESEAHVTDTLERTISLAEKLLRIQILNVSLITTSKAFCQLLSPDQLIREFNYFLVRTLSQFLKLLVLLTK
jgi:hypothetical protein